MGDEFNEVESPPCDGDPEEQAHKASHILDIEVDATGHPLHINCSCGHEFKTELIGIGGTDVE